MYMVKSGKFLKIWLIIFYAFIGLLAIGYTIFFSVLCFSSETPVDLGQFMWRMSGGPPEENFEEPQVNKRKRVERRDV